LISAVWASAVVGSAECDETGFGAVVLDVVCDGWAASATTIDASVTPKVAGSALFMRDNR
jgi:hypothetical protein